MKLPFSNLPTGDDALYLRKLGFDFTTFEEGIVCWLRMPIDKLLECKIKNDIGYVHVYTLLYVNFVAISIVHDTVTNKVVMSINKENINKAKAIIIGSSRDRLSVPYAATLDQIEQSGLVKKADRIEEASEKRGTMCITM